MGKTKDEVVHDLAMACVNGVITFKAVQEAKDEYAIVNGSDFALDAIMAYKEAWDMIYPQIDVKDE